MICQSWRYLGLIGVADSLQRKYDMLGNMIADSSLGVLEQRYDYRNQLVYARTTTTASGAPPDTLTFVYDQTQKRISKRYWYEYWSTCPDGGAINPIGLAPEPKLQFGVASSDDPPTQFTLTGTGGNTVPCLKIAVAETHYLYDGGVLIATFDESDRVRDFFINGPNGRIADYQFNDDAKLVYYLNDHLGSPRAIVQPGASPQMVSYTHYYPFGATLESWTSGVYNQFLYTGKERDQHGAFDYYYFGARYYDATTGTFTSFDKASQFPGGFRYGNDPILGVDGNGNPHQHGLHRSTLSSDSAAKSPASLIVHTSGAGSSSNVVAVALALNPVGVSSIVYVYLAEDITSTPILSNP